MNTKQLLELIKYGHTWHGNSRISFNQREERPVFIAELFHTRDDNGYIWYEHGGSFDYFEIAEEIVKLHEKK